MFWENFKALCDDLHESPNNIASKLGISSGTVTNWKNGAEPRVSQLIKISSYFNVSLDFLILGTRTMKELRTDENELLAVYNSLVNDQDRRDLLGAVKIYTEMHNFTQSEDSATDMQQAK